MFKWAIFLNFMNFRSKIYCQKIIAINCWFMIFKNLSMPLCFCQINELLYCSKFLKYQVLEWNKCVKCFSFLRKSRIINFINFEFNTVIPVSSVQLTYVAVLARAYLYLKHLHSLPNSVLVEKRIEFEHRLKMKTISLSNIKLLVMLILFKYYSSSLF